MKRYIVLLLLILCAFLALEFIIVENDTSPNKDKEFGEVFLPDISLLKIRNDNVLPDSLSIFCQELLGRPTSNSVVINACANKSLNVYYEYGPDSVNYTNQTSVLTTLDSIPFNIKITGLNSNTRYYYRMKYRLAGTTSYSSRPSHSFMTKRTAGSTFTFAIEADPHMDTNSLSSVYTLTLQNMKLRKPDFLIDLGDTFMSEKLVTKTPVTVRDRHLLLRSYFDIVCHSVPLYLVLGNHEGECGWYRDTTSGDNFPVWASNSRTMYFPNPIPDTSFYTGNTKSEPFVGLRQNYYAWEWGNALFVVIDPYWYTMTKPGWNWTLGQTQFNWFKNVLMNSTAKFKFVFCHQVVGGNGTDGRGGVEIAHLFENGGRNLDSTWGFDTYRSGWGGKPVHQLMVENKVNIFFHGHDHFFGYQVKDGVIYQELPQPSAKSYTNMSATQYGYVNGVFIPSRGYALMTITGSSAKLEYIRTYLPAEENSTRHNLDVSYSYTIDTLGTVIGVNEPKINIADKFSLNQNYPNPFNPETKINYSLPSAGNVMLKIYDLSGREVTALINEHQAAGDYTVAFNPEKFSLASGIYYYRLTFGDFSKSLKMVYIK